jgi:hypothetical protein
MTVIYDFDENESDYTELQEQALSDKRRFWQNIKHPDCRDPDHAGCENCEETEENL